MKSKLFKYFIVLLMGVLSADDHETKVSGTVYRNEKNIPLQGANVIFKGRSGNEYGASTDNNGMFDINEISPGDYNIKISFIGFEDFSKSIVIEPNKVYKVDAILSIEPILMAKLEIISEVEAPYEIMPGAATVMDMHALKLVNPIGTQEMLEYVPGINAFADDGIGNSRISIGIRGLNPR